MDIFEFSKIISSEKRALKYLTKLRWPNGIRCPKCNSKRTSQPKGKRYYCIDCSNRFTLYTGTYLSWCKIKPQVLISAVKLFTLEHSARKTAKELNLNYKTILSLFDTIRSAIIHHNINYSYLKGEVELDETYIGGRCKGKRGRGAGHKIPVFGMIERNGKVIVEIVPNVSSFTLNKVIKERVKKSAKVYTDQFKSYSSLIINGYDHVKIDREKYFANGKTHINSIESFWAYAKERLTKYHGIKPQKLYLYLKELEFRFNNRNNNNLEAEILTYLLNFTTSSG